MKKIKKITKQQKTFARFIVLVLKFTCYLQTVPCVAPKLPAAFYVLLEKIRILIYFKIKNRSQCFLRIGP